MKNDKIVQNMFEYMDTDTTDSLILTYLIWS